MKRAGKPNCSGDDDETEVRELKASGLASDVLKRLNSHTSRHKV